LIVSERDAWGLGRILAGHDADDAMADMTVAFRPLAERLASAQPEERSGILDGFSLSLPDSGAFLKAVALADRDGPAPDPEATRPPRCATLASLRSLMADTPWRWPGWLAPGALNALAADPGVGKTLLAMTLAVILWHRRPWPDGQPNPFPERTKTLWVPGDHHYAQLLDVATKYGLPDEAILLNASEDSPTGGLDLDDPAELDAMRERIGVEAPGLVIVDTVGMTTSRNLCKPEDAREYFGPLMTIATETRTEFLLLTHLSKDSQALGRRIVGASRVVWKLTHPDPEGQPDRRRLSVDKSYGAKPPALGMTIADVGCTFDFNPPAEPEPRRPGPAPAKLKACISWLAERLTNPSPVTEVRSDAEQAGYSTGVLYEARDSLKAAEYTFDRRKWWKLPAVEDADVLAG
jgi:hypothetical protein